jgi:8-oxo-dGTP pyrophosphatase MutT (NUDIX family)
MTLINWPKNPFITKTHTGVYGIVRKDGQILLIKKARGPYTGLYDLPGGSQEPFETIEETLVREIKEETGCDVVSFQKIGKKTILFSSFTKQSGQSGCLEHTGFLFDVQVRGEPSTLGDGIDSAGAVWVDEKDLSSLNATPFVLIAIQKEVISLANDEGVCVDVGVRKQNIPESRFPIIGAVLLFRSSGKLVLQQIACSKKNDGGKWSFSAAGHVDAGEMFDEAALRELKEEMGVEGSVHSYIGCVRKWRETHFGAFYHGFKVVSDDEIFPDSKEVESVGEFELLEIQEMIKQNPSAFKDVFVQLFDLYLKTNGF